jgi:GNAT superfamily N-acetyltransferase
MQVQLHQAQTRHLDQLEPLVAAYHAFEGIPSNANMRTSALRMLLDNASLGALWLVRVDAELAGYIALCRGFSIEFNGFDAFIDEFFLLPGFRGRGVGKQVLAAIAGEARRLDIRALHLEVGRDNLPARKLYAGAGFEPREKYLLMSLTLQDNANGKGGAGGDS